GARQSAIRCTSALSRTYESPFPLAALNSALSPQPYITTPPFTKIAWPVRNAAAGDARKTATRATSSGVPHRFRGVEAETVLRVSSSRPVAKDVRIQPGARTLTRTRGATERASDLLKARTPPFAAANS